MRQTDCGFTLTEVLLTLSLFSTLLLTVFSIFTTAQQNYFTSVGAQQAQLRTTSTIEAMRDDLVGAKIEGSKSHTDAEGMVYVIFRRLDSVGTMASTTQDRVWQEISPTNPQPYHMYVWCFQRVAAPCTQFQGRLPESNELILAQSSTSSVNGPWVFERVMIGNMDTWMEGAVVVNDPAIYPFQLSIANDSVTLMRIRTVVSILGLGGSRLIREDRRLSFRLRNNQQPVIP